MTGETDAPVTSGASDGLLVSLPESERTLASVRRILRARLAPPYGTREADAMTRLIFAALKDWTTLTDLMTHADTVLSSYTLAKIDSVLDGLRRDVPIQYLLGKAHFYGMDLNVSPAVLIPRPETAELVDIIVEDIRKDGDPSDLRVLDIGTGSGAIAIALARNLRFPDVTALDISGQALDIARRNAEELHAHIRFCRQDILTGRLPDGAPDKYDIIVSNPPYVLDSEKSDMERNVLDYEPGLALFVPDSDPLRFYRPIAEIAADALTDIGRLYLEINPLCADALLRLLEKDGFRNVSLLRDSEGKQRFISATGK